MPDLQSYVLSCRASRSFNQYQCLLCPANEMKLQLHVIGVSTLDSQSKGTKSTLDSQSKGTNASSIRRPVVNEERLSPGLATCCVQCFDTLR